MEYLDVPRFPVDDNVLGVELAQCVLPLVESLDYVDEPHDDILGLVLLEHVLHYDFLEGEIVTETVHEVQ